MKNANYFFLFSINKTLSVSILLIGLLLALTQMGTVMAQSVISQKPMQNHRASQFQVKGTDTIYLTVQERPVFPGGNEAMQRFKAVNTKYPDKLKKMGIEGIAMLSFVVNEDGSVSDIKIIRGVSPSLDKEAIRVTKKMPKWQAAKENGKPVKYMYGTSYEFMLSPRVPPVPKEGEPFVVVEEMPMFPGGDEALLKYIVSNVKYPESARAGGIEGRVIVRFCVTESGGIDRVSVLKGVNPELDSESVRVVKSLPEFKPGKQGGKAVPVWYMVPITFGLNNSSATSPENQSTKKPAQKAPEIRGYDVIPSFPGGEKAIFKFINKNLRYPENALANQKSGVVHVSFRIDENGQIEETRIAKAIDPDLDAEAIRIIKLLPDWKPGMSDGKPVKVWYTIPVTFTIK